MLTRIFFTLGLIAISRMGVAAEFPKQVLICATESGGAKSNCQADVLVKKEAELSDFTIEYNYVCRKIFSRSVPAMAATAVQGAASPVTLTPGQARQVTVREAKEVHFGFTGQANVALSSDCSITVTKVVVVPAESRIQALKGEARRLTDLLKVQGVFYKSVLDTHTLLDQFTLPQLQGMVNSLQSILGESLEQAFGSSGDLSQPGVCNAGQAEKMPSDFGLSYWTWQELDVFQEGLVTLDSTAGQYVVTVNQERHPYYFEARSVLPMIGSILAQIANVKQATRLKESAARDGFVIPDVRNARQELDRLIQEARQFQNRVKTIQDRLRSELDALNASLTAVSP